jgi:hypothetical protein
MLLLTVIIWSLGRSIFNLLFSTSRIEATHVPRSLVTESISQYILLVLAIWWGVYPPDALVDCLRSVMMELV